MGTPSSGKLPNFALRDAHQSDYPFAKMLYIKTMKPLLLKLDAWDEAAVIEKFNGHYILDEVQVVTINGTDAGWLQVSETAQELELAQIHIKRAFCSMGVGTQLIRNLMNQAHGKGKPVFLSVVRGNRALSLYQRLGFRVIDKDEHKLHMRWKSD